MSSSSWGSWCRACRRKRGVSRGGDRFDWWKARREELVSDRLAMKPKYGPEACFDCDGPYETAQYIFAPNVHDEMRGENVGQAEKICSSCWYEENETPPDQAMREDGQMQCSRCRKEVVQVIHINKPAPVVYDDEDEEELEPVELMVDMRRHVCTQEYATVYVEVPAEWADDVAYYEDEILESALGQGYGPDWEMDTEIHSDEPAEIAEIEVV